VIMFYLIEQRFARSQMKNIIKSSSKDLKVTPKTPKKRPGKKDDKARAKALRDNLLKRKEQLKKREEEKTPPTPRECTGV